MIAMQISLRVFSIIALVLIIASSTNISFKSGNDVNSRINTGGAAALIDSTFFSIDDKLFTFSSLLQTISAQEQGEQEVEQDENGKDPDAVMEREEEIKEDCRSGQHFDSEVNSCIPDQENVCDDDIDNDNDSRVDLEDSDCLPSKNDQEQEQDNRDEDKEQEASLDNKENDKGGENPISIEQQQDNNTSSEDSSNIEDKAQNNSQNFTDNNSTETTSTTTTNNNNASLNEFLDANASSAVAVQDSSFTLKCPTEGAEMLPGEEDSITCTIENKSPKPIVLVLQCSGLDGTGIDCYINGEYPTQTTLIKEISHTNFSVILVSRSSPPVPAGSYPFTISAEQCINSDLC